MPAPWAASHRASPTPSSGPRLAPSGWSCKGQRWTDERTSCRGRRLPRRRIQSNWPDPEEIKWSTLVQCNRHKIYLAVSSRVYNRFGDILWLIWHYTYAKERISQLRTKSTGLPLGTLLDNEASISFDYMYMYMYLWVLTCHSAHLLRVQLYRVVAKFGLRRGLEVLATNRKVAVSLHPPGREKE